MLRKILPSVLAQRTDVLSPRMIRLIEELADDWRRLDDRINAVTSEVQALASQLECCRRLTSVPGDRSSDGQCSGGHDREWRGLQQGARLWSFGSGWCRSNSPQATERYSVDSANAATNTCARHSSSGLAPCWQSPAAGPSLGSEHGWQPLPSASTITSWLRRLPTNSRALHGACSITAVHSRETSSHRHSRPSCQCSIQTIERVRRNDQGSHPSLAMASSTSAVSRTGAAVTSTAFARGPAES